jgi:ERCC4-type nuclease
MSDTVPLVVDTREQHPYTFAGVDTVREKMDVGDYTYEGFADTFAVERKSMDDLATSLGTDRDRFEDEIRRAQSLEEFVVIVEESWDKMLAFQDNDTCPLYFSEIHPNSVIATVRKWPRKYDTLTFTWAGSREQAQAETLRQLDTWYLEYADP